ncbi:flagellar hook-associated protein FlgK, partial [Clostridium neonatale]|uniref:flagellar hook-associated protein FlgK n=1 Tax=Clostridium neonatale TaxID=137838 RepID=UPI003D355439
NTSSHNIANANTVGYSRQRSVIETTRPFGGASRFDTCTVGQVGTGAEVTAIQRVRDTFLDYQVRNKTTESGTLDIKYQYLYQTESILNDSSDSGIQNALNEFFDAFQEISKAPEKTSNKDVAISQAAALADMINSKYTQLEQKKSDAQKLLGQNVQEINDILDSINSLNKQISSVAAVGMTPNDLMDKRDNLLDELSSKFGINVDRDKYETINVTASESGVSIDGVNKLVASSPNDEYLRFSYISDVKKTADGELELTYNKLGNDKDPVTIKVNCDKGKEQETIDSLLETRVVLTDSKGNITKTDGTAVDATGISIDDLKKVLVNSGNGIRSGEIAGNQSAQESIQNAMDDLDKLAISLAYTVNAIQTGSLDGTGGLKYSDGTSAELIFVVKDGTTDDGINAKNISLNSAIKNDSSKLICGEDIADITGDKAGTRALAIANLSSKLKIDYTAFEIDGITRDKFFNGNVGSGDSKEYSGTGIKFKDTAINQDLTTDKEGSTIKDYYIKITSNLGIDVKAAKENLTTVASELESYEEQRLSVSGVSLDEEMTDLITFQHAYQANAKMINTIDQLLDVVINGLKA